MANVDLLNVEVLEKQNQLRIVVESVYGVDNLGLSIQKKYLDPDTDMPKWISEASKLLERKYNKSVDKNKLYELSKTEDKILTDIENN